MRYSRHTLLPEVGVEGQRKLLDSKVLLIGAGGLGAPSALYLAAAGVGTLGIVDDDVVDESNLQRQVIHDTERVGMAKTASARQTIEALNPDVAVVEHNTRLDASNILELLEPYDVIVDGADNFPTRYLLNDASVRLGKPVVSASILGFDGQLSTFVPHEGPCYRCLYPVPPPPELAPSCGANGVLGVMAGVMGLLQANEVIKLAAGIGEPLVGRLLLYESLGTRFTELKVKRDPRVSDLRRRTLPRSPRGRWVQLSRLRALLRGARARALAGRRLTATVSTMPTVKIPPAAAPADRGRGELTVGGSTVGEVLSALADTHPDTRGQLFSEDGELNRYVNVYLNDEDVRVLDGLKTGVSDADTVVILPAMAGGWSLSCRP